MFIALAATLVLASGQPPAPPPPVPLHDGWTLHVGDLPSPQAAETETAWVPVKVPGSLENVAPGHDGFVWYRRTVEVSDALREVPIGIRVEMAGDSYEAYWNGVRIGGSGGFPPRFSESGDGVILSVPERALAAAQDGRHTLLVRVYNEYAYGGLMGPVRFGSVNALAAIRRPTDMVAGSIAAFLLAIALFHAFLFLRQPADRAHGHFALLCGALVLVTITFLPSYNPELSEWVNNFRLRLLGMYLGAAAFAGYAGHVLRMRPTAVGRATRAAFFVAAAAVTLPRLATLAVWMPYLDAVLLASAAVVAVRVARHRPEGRFSRTLQAGMLAFLGCAAADVMAEHGWAANFVNVVPGISGVVWFGMAALVVAMEAATATRYAEAEEDARTDRLTGLVRRHVWDDAVAREVASVRSGGGTVAVAVLDLDHFKRVNDLHGHRVGDEVLRQVGWLLRNSTRDGDLPARLGGEEFGVLLPGADATGAAAYAERLRTSLSRLVIPVAGGALGVRASVGVAVGGGDVEADALREAADQALYRAKRAGRDRCVVTHLLESGPAGLTLSQADGDGTAEADEAPPAGVLRLHPHARRAAGTGAD